MGHTARYSTFQHFIIKLKVKFLAANKKNKLREITWIFLHCGDLMNWINKMLI